MMGECALQFLGDGRLGRLSDYGRKKVGRRYAEHFTLPVFIIKNNHSTRARITSRKWCEWLVLSLNWDFLNSLIETRARTAIVYLSYNASTSRIYAHALAFPARRSHPESSRINARAMLMPEGDKRKFVCSCY